MRNLNQLDGIFYENYWNNLEPGVQIFDPIPNRTPTIFGRLTNSSLSWFDSTADWRKLYDNPDPIRLILQDMHMFTLTVNTGMN